MGVLSRVGVVHWNITCVGADFPLRSILWAGGVAWFCNFTISPQVSQLRDVNKLFGWGNEVVKRTVNKLKENGVLVKAEHPKSTGEWVGLGAVCK